MVAYKRPLSTKRHHRMHSLSYILNYIEASYTIVSEIDQ